MQSMFLFFFPVKRITIADRSAMTGKGSMMTVVHNDGTGGTMAHYNCDIRPIIAHRRHSRGCGNPNAVLVPLFSGKAHYDCRSVGNDGRGKNYDCRLIRPEFFNRWHTGNTPTTTPSSSFRRRRLSIKSAITVLF